MLSAIPLDSPTNDSDVHNDPRPIRRGGLQPETILGSGKIPIGASYETVFWQRYAM
jgi:hypothetical protein